MSETKHLIVVGGATASGKTELAIRLARHFRTAIVSCDSRQFFREMRIGTAVPSPEELAQAPHHFIGQLSIEDSYSVGDFERDALALLSRLFQQHDVVILAGGSGLYTKALCEGLDEFPEVPAAVRREVEQHYQEQGLSALQAELLAADPDYYREVDLQNPHRLIRALAVFRASGRPFSSFRTGAATPRPFVPVYLQTHWPRARLYERIDQRVDRMMAAGLLAEVRQLLPHRERTPLQTVGYQELFDHLAGKTTLPEAVELIKRNTRRYAKRQLTWLRRDGFWKHIGPSDWSIALEYIELVRTNGLRLQESAVTAEAAPHSNAGDRRLCLAGPPHRSACLRMTGTGRTSILWRYREEALSSNLTRTLPYLLLHEASCRLEGTPIFAILPEKIEPLAVACGFESVPFTTDLIPPVVEKFREEAAAGNPISLLQRNFPLG